MSAASDEFSKMKESMEKKTSKMGKEISEKSDKMMANTKKALNNWGSKISSFFD